MTKNELNEFKLGLMASLEKQGIPDNLSGAISRYVLNGIAPGGFLTGCLTDSLSGALSNADGWSEKNLSVVFKFLYNHIPNGAWGSQQKFDDWCAEGGLAGKGGKV